MKSLPLSHKKGMALQLEALIGLVLAVIAMVAILYAGAKIGALFFPSSPDAATTNNVKTLAHAITSIVESGKEKEALRHLPFYLGKGYILVGFPRGSAGLLDVCYKYLSSRILPSLRGEEYVNKPISCGESACLCLYKDLLGYDDFQNTVPIKNSCFPLEKTDAIYSYYYDDEKKEEVPTEARESIVGGFSPEQFPSYGGWSGRYQYFFLYGGGCFDGPFGVQNLYLDMHQDEHGRTQVFVAPESCATQNRWNELMLGTKGYSPCFSTDLDKLLTIIRENRDINAVREAIHSILSSSELITEFVAATSPEGFRTAFFQLYKAPPAHIPSITEISIRKNAAYVWESYPFALLKIGIPYLGEDSYLRICVTAWKSEREENDCWVPKHLDLNA